MRIIMGIPMRKAQASLLRPDAASSTKKNTNLSLSETLVAEAKSFGINLSKACERGLKAEIADKRAALWLEQNREAISAWNDYVACNPLPLARFRAF